MDFIDSHVHLSDYGEPGKVLGVGGPNEFMAFACSVNKATSGKTLRLEREFPGTIAAFVGLHPSEATGQDSAEWVSGLLRQASGVGEIGLDPKYSDVGQSSPQMRLFLEQLGTAEAAGKPVQVHTRNSESSCLELLGSHRLSSVLLHWFSGEACLRRAEEMGCFVSFGPALLESRKLQRIATSYNSELILAESDGPVSFGCTRGATGPPTLPSVIFRLAELKKVTFEEMAEMTARNALAFLPSFGKVKPTNNSGFHS